MAATENGHFAKKMSKFFWIKKRKLTKNKLIYLKNRFVIRCAFSGGGKKHNFDECFNNYVFTIKDGKT